MSKRSKRKPKLTPAQHPTQQSQPKNKQLLQQIQGLEVSTHQGPLPPPELFEGYNNILPGAAGRILSMAEKQSSHRQDLELRVVKAGARDSLIGLIFGFILGFFTIGGGIFCIIKGQSTGGTIIGGAGLVSLVGVFVYGSRQRRKERESKKS